MSDGQILALLFTGLYLLDCIRWSPPHSRVFTRWWGRNWRATARQGSIMLAGFRPSLLNPLPNLGDHLSPDSWPVLPTDKGLHRISREGRVLPLIPWSEIEIRRELGTRKITLSKPHSPLLFGSASAAELWESTLRAYQSGAPIPPAFTKDAFSLPRAKAALRRQRIASSQLRSWCVQAWLLCALALPITITLLGTHVVSLVAIALLFIAILGIAVTYYRVAPRVHPELKRTLGTSSAVLALVPFHAIRACDLLSAEAAGSLHPITVAAVTLDDEHFKTFAASEWRSWNYGISPRPQILLDGIEKVAASRNLQLSDLNAPPSQPDSSTTSFCPRCHTTFTESLASCPDCTHVQPEQF